MIEELTMSDTNQYHKYISDFFKENYEELFSIAVKNTANTEFNPEDLISYTYELLIKKEEQVKALKDLNIQDGYTKTPLMRYCGDIMYSEIREYKANNGNSNFKGMFSTKKFVPLPSMEETDSPNDFDQPQYRLNENLTPEQIKKIELVEHIVNNDLDEIEKKLYQLHFIQGIKPYQLKMMIPEISSNSARKMINDLKQKISQKAKNYLRK